MDAAFSYAAPGDVKLKLEFTDISLFCSASNSKCLCNGVTTHLLQRAGDENRVEEFARTKK